MLEVSLEGTTRLDSLGRRLRVATEKKMIVLTDMLYEKVIENVSGKILEVKTGKLRSAIHKANEVEGDFYIGTVFVDPADDKAWALEKGGKGYYPIVATKAEVLHFFTKSGQEIFTKAVNHPPSREFAYMRTALEEMAEIIPQGFREYIQQVLGGSEF